MKKLGVINGFVPSFVIFNGKKVLFNGTTLDKVKSLLSAGAKIGDSFISGDRKLCLIGANDSRTGNVWSTEWNEKI